MNTHHYITLIPAAGVGSRMGTDVPKQYLPLQDHPLLYYTILPFYQHHLCEKVVVVLSPEDRYWAEFAEKKAWGDYQAPRLEVIYCGGETRAQSVLNGLQALKENQWVKPDQLVAVHDAARPCLPFGTLNQFVSTIKDEPLGAAMAMPVVETVKQVENQALVVAKTIPRETLWLTQTPQMFRFEPLYLALTKLLATPEILPTDECHALEQAGYQPRLVLGHRYNIKVTRPEDLPLASFYLTQIPYIST